MSISNWNFHSVDFVAVSQWFIILFRIVFKALWMSQLLERKPQAQDSVTHGKTNDTKRRWLPELTLFIISKFLLNLLHAITLYIKTFTRSIITVLNSHLKLPSWYLSVVLRTVSFLFCFVLEFSVETYMYCLWQWILRCGDEHPLLLLGLVWSLSWSGQESGWVWCLWLLWLPDGDWC